MRIQSIESLEAEMRAVARGEMPAPADAAEPSYNSMETIVRLLTVENRLLLAMIRDRRPQSVAELAQMTGRAPSNLTRTLDKLQAAGLVRIDMVDRRKVPTAEIRRIHIEIDPFGTDDRLEFT